MAKSEEVIASEERALFFAWHWQDVRTFTAIPLYAGISFAPLFYSASTTTQWVFALTVFTASLISGHYLGKWANYRFGLAKPLFPSRKRGESNEERRSRRLRTALWVICAMVVFPVLATLIEAISPLHVPAHHSSGWLERGAVSWAMSCCYWCIRIACDRSNLKMRRRRYALSAVLLTLLMAAAVNLPHANACVTLLFTTVMTVLSLLDLQIMFRFAPQTALEEFHV